MEPSSPPAGLSPHQLAAFWRQRAQQYQDKNLELQKEFDDHVETSTLLEREFETTLDQKEKLIRELRQQIQRLEKESDVMKRKLDRVHHENNQLESDLHLLKNEKDRYVSYIRELEQKNDDLERGQRVVSESVAGIETLLHQAYERNAVLESELDEMENLRIKLQRATDEARDLKQELHVKDKLPNGNVPGSPILKTDLNVNRKIYNGIDSNKLMETETQTSMTGTPFKMNDITLNGNTMTPSSRISALNIVGDLLRKVGGLESKLASCRAPIHTRESSVDYNRDPYRMRKLSSRGPVSPAITPNFIH